MPNTLRIRRASATDAPWLLELFSAVVPGREFLPRELLVMQEQAQRSQWSQRWGSGGESLVEVDGAAAARVWVAWTPSALRIVELSVAPAFRGQGLGSRLLADLCSAADTAGQTMELAVDAENTVARHLYESLGFRTWNNPVHPNGFSLTMKRTPEETTTP
ncbi:GNAT family N-acetyltransferase [Arthrobacter sp. BF1]|uniref:GNAT family N-acetyltransferase n=1 Tax=Arthrobacter sp. BF1 TaxID=2821145 RepID=UPI001C4EB40C|nr:N-acetyltransferase [Arthrobacter sp. BF1]